MRKALKRKGIMEDTELKQPPFTASRYVSPPSKWPLEWKFQDCKILGYRGVYLPTFPITLLIYTYESFPVLSATSSYSYRDLISRSSSFLTSLPFSCPRLIHFLSTHTHTSFLSLLPSYTLRSYFVLYFRVSVFQVKQNYQRDTIQRTIYFFSIGKLFKLHSDCTSGLSFGLQTDVTGRWTTQTGYTEC